MTVTINNLIGGNPTNIGNKYFKVRSPFYNTFELNLADSSSIDISIALSKAKQSWDACQSLSLKERAEIINTAATNLTFSEAELNSIVKMTGMPIKYISLQINQIPTILTSFWQIISQRYGLKYGNIGLDFMENKSVHKIEFRISRNGFVYAVTPGNDPRITAIVSTVLVLLGIPGIIKPSKIDTLIPIKIVKALLDSGYPKNGLSVIFFDPENPKTKEHHFKICDAASVIWPFGDENTVDNLLRLEKYNIFNLDNFLKEKEISGLKTEFPKFLKELEKSKNSLNNYLSEQIIDHFSSKLIIRHASGRCAGIVDSNFDPKLAADLLIKSSMQYPIGCNSMKSVFVVEAIFDKLVENLNKKLVYLDEKTSDPLNLQTEVGYVDKKTVSFLESRTNELKRMKLISILHGGKKLGPYQLTPLLIATNDINSELLINEISGYILCIAKIKTFEEGVSIINKITMSNPKLAVSYFTNNPKNMRLYTNAHHIKINAPTTDLEGIVHEGNDYIMQLTRPHIIHINKKGLKEHPYREK